MYVAIVGAGGVGGYFGGLLAQAGHQVAFIARGEHLRALRAEGLKVQSVHGDFEVRPALATDNPGDIGETNLVIFAVKTYDTDQAASLMRPLVGKQTTILPLQNGVESATKLGQYFPKENIIGGLTQVMAYIAQPGVIKQESQFRRIVLGELDGRETPRLKAISEALTQTGATIEVTTNIEKALWTKLLFIASFSGVTSMTRTSAGPVMAYNESRLLLKQAMTEVAAVARAQNIPLDPDVVDKTMDFVAKMEPTGTASMQRDVIAGRRLEYDALNGAVVRVGRARGVPTPAHEFIWTCLKVVDSYGR